jgi:transforming growth factor-beta-induced protein
MPVILSEFYICKKSKTMNKFITLSVIFLLILNVSSCLDDDSSQIIDNTPSTFERIANSDVHNTLEQLLIETNLDDALSMGVYTIFAPTDEAFAAVDLEGLSNEEVVQLLLNHVISGSAESTDFSNGYIFSSATENFTGNENNINMYVNVDGGITLNGVSTVITDNINASNGVVHVVDAVIPIPDITTFATADSRFDTLVEALTRDDQPDFVSILSSFDSPAPFTVFGPTNDAFSDLLVELDLTDLSEIDTATLTSTLNTHVVAGELLREESLTLGTVNTLGDDFELDPSINVITDLNGRDINIIITNVQAGNGVIHVVDQVILPQLP